MSKFKEFIFLTINIFHRILCFLLKLIFDKWIYSEKGQNVPPIKNQLLLESATSLVSRIRNQEITSVDVLKAYIDRVKEINPIVNCVVDERFSEALKEAQDADLLISSGKLSKEELKKSKPFLGVPVSIKECIAVKNQRNTCGWWERKDIRAVEDAPVVIKLKEAGAIPFCLTNMPELCMYYESSNLIYGRTKNAYDSNRISGGSSGGEGVINGVGAAPFGIGSDIGGSIRIPAMMNGVFGHKPTKLVVSNDLHFPPPHNVEQKNMLCVGPLARHATDLMPILKVIVKDDKLKLLKLDESVDVRKLKIYYQENDFGGLLVSPVEEDIQIGMRAVVNYFKNDLKMEVTKTQITRTKETLNMYFANYFGTKTPTVFEQLSSSSFNHVVEIFKAIIGKSKHTLPVLLLGVKTGNDQMNGSKKHQHFLNERNKIAAEFNEILKDDISVFLYPTHPNVAPYHHYAFFKIFNFVYTCLFSMLGYPSCHVPLGIGREGLPVGIQVVSNHHNDRLCLAVACELERKFGGWRQPS